jgi:anti-sigma factor RsiW
MKCEHVAPLIDAHADGELDEARAAAVDRHLAGCAACTRRLAAIAELRDGLRAIGRYGAPPELDRRVRRVIQAASARPGRAIAWRSFGLGLGAGIAAMAALVAGFVVLGPTPPARSGGAVDFVSAHLRSLMKPESTEIASNDPHTIRPWLAGRTDLSPQVADLADAGYPLLGARIDYVDGRPAVALVYGRRKHRINLFAQAADGASDVPAAAARRGHAVVSWRAGDFRYVAVSDLSPDELDAFARLLRARNARPPS